jgi:hypothetical protein
MSRAYDRDPYAILGVSSAATASQVKEAYHRLARRYHPDLNKAPRAGEQMKDVNWAYDILSDPGERSLYDYWRNSNAWAGYDYPGTNPSSRRPEGQAPEPDPPPYNPVRGRTYPNIPVPRRTPVVGCSSWGIIWVIIIVITNLVRAFGPSLSQRPNYDYSPEIRALQTAQMEKMESTIQTLSAPLGTPSPFHGLFLTPSPIPMTNIPKKNADQRDMQPDYAPGSWIWEQLHRYFPELTTADGLSAEVTDVMYDQLRGYHIKTRNSGDYWLFINPYDKGVTPAHSPRAATITPPP